MTEFPTTAPAATRRPPGADAPGPTLLLSYADPAAARRDAEDRRRAMFERVGGWRQISFAVGLGFLVGGVAYCMWPRSSEAVFWIGLGALLVGLALPLPPRQ